MDAHDDPDRPIGHANACLQKQPPHLPWIWEGVLALEAVTLLSAPEKTGKTTLLSLLLDRRRAGGELLGRTVYPGKTVVCSEENERLWTLRQPPLDFGPDLIFHKPPGPFPMRGRWRRFIDDLCTLSLRDDPFDLLVIDTAASFMPLADRNKRTLQWALAQLTLVADSPAAVLILNQSRNVHRPLAAFADIVIEMAIPRPHTPRSPFGRGAGGEGIQSPLSPSGSGAGGEGTRRRIFTGVGRYPETLQTAAAELNADGTDYVLLPDSPPPHAPMLATLQTLLTASPAPLTCRELLTRWPGAAPRPDSLWRALANGLARGLLVATGTGTKTDAFGFGLAPPAHAAPLATGQNQSTCSA